MPVRIQGFTYSFVFRGLLQLLILSWTGTQRNGPKVRSWEISNRVDFSDSERFISTCNDLQEHGRHPKSFQDSLRHRYCVPRCVPRFSRQSRETHRLVAGACNAPKTLVLPFRYKLPETPCSSPHASCKVFAASELARRSRSIWPTGLVEYASDQIRFP